MRCAVFGCNCDNKSKKNPISGVKFFHFPKNKDLAKKWLHATGRKDKVNLKNACVCSKHFSESDFKENLQHKLLNYTPARYRGLKEDAIPNKNLPLAKAVNSCPELGCFSRSSAEAPSHRDKTREDRERKQLIQELLNVSQTDMTALQIDAMKTSLDAISKENKELKENLSAVEKVFSKNQILKLQNNKRIQWSVNEVSNAITLYAAGPKAYTAVLSKKGVSAILKKMRF
ncbi:hypothetical protein ABEB36_013510 [Hypothenemus hampei]|uniref:THAP-type domain-containing protein n=1 Tax=Hypothenemus hampei TaxID=57062 RepID=A0ABD1E6K7_HYPHA